MRKILLVFAVCLPLTVGAQHKKAVDIFWSSPQGTYSERKSLGLSYIRDNSDGYIAIYSRQPVQLQKDANRTENDLAAQGLEMHYQSPSQGKIQFNWENSFVVKGKDVPLRYDYRYDNPFGKTLFDSRTVEIKRGDKRLVLDFEKAARIE